MRVAKRVLTKRQGKIIQIANRQDLADCCVVERHICIDTTASGGNALLLAGSA